eukprot:scaffold61023_cov28-Prasinocladus_malaysianus.AAC.1
MASGSRSARATTARVAAPTAGCIPKAIISRADPAFTPEWRPQALQVHISALSTINLYSILPAPHQ